MATSPLGRMEACIEKGFRPADVRSGPEGITVALRRGDETETVQLTREDARKILGVAGEPVHRICG